MARRRHHTDTGLTRSALRSGPVRRVVAGFAGVTLGEWVLGTTVAIHAYAVGGAFAVGLIGFRFVPAAVAGLWTTQLAEHRRRQRVLTLTALARASATAVGAIALALNAPFALVVALVWLDAAAGSAYRPAQAALLPGLSRTPGELTAVAALTSNVKSLGQIVGALLGGVLVVTLPIPIVVGVAAALYVSSALATAVEGRSGAAAASSGRLRVGVDGLRVGARLLGRNPEARQIVFYSCLRALVRGLWLALAVVASLRLLSLGESGLGVLMGAAGVGALAAILAAALLIGRPRLAVWLAVALALCGLPIAAIGLIGRPAPAVVFMVVWGAGMSLSDVTAQALLNRIVPAAAIGRVTGAMESAKLIFEGCGSLVAPALLVTLGVRGALYAAGWFLPVLVVLGYRGFARIDDRAVGEVETLELLRDVPFFVPLRLDGLERVAALLKTERHPAGTEIVRQGEHDAHRWYLLDGGECVVEVDGFLVGELGHGDQFGECALLRGVSRAATVRAHTDVVLHVLERDDFLAAVAGPDLDETDSAVLPEHPDRIDPATALARAPLLQRVDAAMLEDLRGQTREQEFEAGEPIVRGGAHDDSYYVMLSGRAEVLNDGPVLVELLPGDTFGEIAVLHRVQRRASVVARDRSTVLTLEGEAVRAAVRENGGALAELAS